MVGQVGIQNNVSVSGDTRFDRVIDIAQKGEAVPFIREFIGQQPTLVAGSTWEDDEVELIHYVRLHPETKFIIAPHEIDAQNLADVKKEFSNAVYSELSNRQDIPGPGECTHH